MRLQQWHVLHAYTLFEVHPSQNLQNNDLSSGTFSLNGSRVNLCAKQVSFHNWIFQMVLKGLFRQKLTHWDIKLVSA